MITKEEVFKMVIRNEGYCDFCSFSCDECKKLFDGICPLMKVKIEWAKAELAKLPPEESKTESRIAEGISKGGHNSAPTIDRPATDPPAQASRGKQDYGNSGTG